MGMAVRPPPLESLRIFEACARFGNFTRAAESLAITPTAVSQRVRDLEADLGRRLFERNGPRVALTPEGARLAERLRDGLAIIREAVEEARAARTIRVTAAPTIASRWLAPLLSHFASEGNVAVQVDASAEILSDEHFEVAVRSGSGDWPGLRSWASIPLEGTPMLKPGLAEAAGLAQPADLARVTLLPDERWAEWLVTAGVDPRSVRFGPVEYPTQELAAAAAEAGAGVALLSPSLFRSAVVEGRLFRPFPDVVVGPGAYHILTPAKPLAPEVEHFVGWLVDQLGTAPLGQSDLHIPMQRRLSEL